MSECKQCPHAIGDSTERDCCFPDCIGGWEAAFKTVVADRDELRVILDALREIALNDDDEIGQHIAMCEILEDTQETTKNGKT